MPTNFAGYKATDLPGDKNDYLPANESFRLKIKKTHIKETRNKGDAFIAEFEVVTTSSTDKKYAPGRPVSYYRSLTNRDMAFKEIALFCLAAAGVDRGNPEHADKLQAVTENMGALMNEAVNKNCFENVLVDVMTSRVSSKKDIEAAAKIKAAGGSPPPPKEYTNHRWSPVTHS